MGEPIKECWDRRQYHTGLAHIKRNRRTQFGILGAAIKPKWDGPTYPKGMTQLTNVAGPTLVKPAGPLQVSGLKILTSEFCMILQLTMFTGVSKSLPGTCLAVQMRGLLFHSKFVWEFKFISPL